MNKKLRSIILVILAIITVCSLGVFAGCNNKDDNANYVLFKTNSNVKYRVGDNVDVYDFINVKDKLTYTFTITKDGWDKTQKVVGRTFCVTEAGEYTLTCVVSDEKIKGGETKFTVYDTQPYLLVPAQINVYNLNARIRLDTFMDKVSPYVLSDTEYNLFSDYVDFYTDEDDTEGERYTFTEDEIFYYFRKEGFYHFNIVLENKGGRSCGTLKIKCEENLKELVDIDGANAVFNKATNVVSWNATDGASKYKVKIGTLALYTEETQIDLSSIMPKGDFKHFDIVIIPLTETEEKIGKVILKDIVINPQGYNDTVVISKNTVVDIPNKIATLNGGAPENPLIKSISSFNNDYVAFCGNFGVGYYVEFEFVGNNMPTVCLFSNDITGNITNMKGGKGLLLVNGLTDKGGWTMNNSLRIFGPDRLAADYWTGGDTVLYAFKDCYPLLSQKGLEDKNSTEFKYVLGTFKDACDNLYLDISLYQKSGDSWVLACDDDGTQYSIIQNIGVKVTEYTAGNIVAYASMKGIEKPTTFKFKEPYLGTEKRIPDGFVSSNTRISKDGVYSISPANFYTKDYPNVLTEMKNGYIGYDGDYGVGTYLKINFGVTKESEGGVEVLRADNMPNIILFADNFDSGLTSESGKGILITAGIDSCNNTIKSGKNNRMVIAGPNRINEENKENYLDVGNSIDVLTWERYPLLTQWGLRHITEGEFTYIVGSYLSPSGTVVLDINLYYELDGQLKNITSKQVETGLTESQLTGRKIILTSANKGTTWNSNTVFKAEVCSRENAFPTRFNGIQGTSVINGDNTYSLCQNNFYNVNFENGVVSKLQNDFVGFKGDYGVGAYLKINFGVTTELEDGVEVLRADNMPNIILFADNVNSGLTSNFGKGLLITSGIDACNNQIKSAKNNRMTIYGPNRIDESVASSCFDASNYLSNMIWEYYPLLTQWGLRHITEGEFTYIVGSYLSPSGTVVLDINLYYELNGELKSMTSKQVDTKILASELTGRNMVLTACNKGQTWDGKTTFKAEICSKENAFPTKFNNVQGTTEITANNTYSLRQDNFYNKDVANGKIGQLSNDFVAFKGDYGVGTYLKINFSVTKGSEGGVEVLRADNMPNVILFADNISSGLSSDSGKGILIASGIDSCNNTVKSAKNNRMLIYGPNRIDANAVNNCYVQENALALINYDEQKLFTAWGLREKTEGEFTYVVGSYLSVNGTVVLDLNLTYKVNGVVLQTCQKQIDTNLTESQLTGRNVVLTATNKGQLWDAKTVFTATIGVREDFLAN